MELQGLNDYIFWTYDKDGNVNTDPDKGGFTYDGDKGKVFDPSTGDEIKGMFKVDLESSKGATQANITGLAESVSRVYGSNYVAEVNTGAEQPSIALAANDIPHIISDMMIGLEKDKFGGYARKGQAKATRGGLLVHSYNPYNGIDFYFAFPMGIYVPGELNLQTNTENATVVHDAMTLNAQARGTDLLLYEKFYSDETNFDYGNMLRYVSGQTIVDKTSGNKEATDPQGNPVHTPGNTTTDDSKKSETTQA